jgi:hypothetical protein
MTPKSRAGFLIFALSALTLGGCTQATVANVSSSLPVYSTDLQGRAAQCSAPPTNAVAEGKTLSVAMTTGGNGWCGMLIRNGSGPYAAGLLTRRPEHGKVYVHSVGDDTRIDYTSLASPVVADAFTVRLIPGNALVEVSVKPATPGVVK